MPLGLRGEIKALRALIEAPPLDIAVRFDEYEAVDSHGHARPTGRTSPIYGGRYDIWRAKYVGPAETYIIVACTPAQFKLVLTDAIKVEAAGGRGSGKSEGGVLRALRFVVEIPGGRGRITSPRYRQTKAMWRKLLSRFPRSWLLPGRSGVKKADRMLMFGNGHILEFSSAHDADALRSEDYDHIHNDEAQDISQEAIDNNWFCLRSAKVPHMTDTLTPKPEVYDRHVQYAEEDETECIEFSSYDNCFINKTVFDIARKRYEKRRYLIEVEADWDTIAEMVGEENKLVFDGFQRATHCVKWPMLAEDITRAVIQKKTGYSRQYAIGIDPNWDWPNYAVVFKCVKLPSSSEPTWVAVDVISRKGHCGHLGRSLKKHGYNGQNSYLVPDASAKYNRGKKSSARLLRAEGFKAMCSRAKNLDVVDSIDAVREKLFPVDGPPRLLIAERQCQELVEAIELAVWSPDGKHIKKTGEDHVCDAMRYVIDFFEPAAHFKNDGNRIRLYVGKRALA